MADTACGHAIELLEKVYEMVMAWRALGREVDLLARQLRMVVKILKNIRADAGLNSYGETVEEIVEPLETAMAHIQTLCAKHAALRPKKDADGKKTKGFRSSLLNGARLVKGTVKAKDFLEELAQEELVVRKIMELLTQAKIHGSSGSAAEFSDKKEPLAVAMLVPLETFNPAEWLAELDPQPTMIGAYMLDGVSTSAPPNPMRSPVLCADPTSSDALIPRDHVNIRTSVNRSPIPTDPEYSTLVANMCHGEVLLSFSKHAGANDAFAVSYRSELCAPQRIETSTNSIRVGAGDVIWLAAPAAPVSGGDHAVASGPVAVVPIFSSASNFLGGCSIVFPDPRRGAVSVRVPQTEDLDVFAPATTTESMNAAPLPYAVDSSVEPLTIGASLFWHVFQSDLSAEVEDTELEREILELIASGPGHGAPKARVRCLRKRPLLIRQRRVDSCLETLLENSDGWHEIDAGDVIFLQSDPPAFPGVVIFDNDCAPHPQAARQEKKSGKAELLLKEFTLQDLQTKPTRADNLRMRCKEGAKAILPHATLFDKKNRKKCFVRLVGDRLDLHDSDTPSDSNLAFRFCLAGATVEAVPKHKFNVGATDRLVLKLPQRTHNGDKIQPTFILHDPSLLWLPDLREACRMSTVASCKLAITVLSGANIRSRRSRGALSTNKDNGDRRLRVEISVNGQREELRQQTPDVRFSIRPEFRETRMEFYVALGDELVVLLYEGSKSRIGSTTISIYDLLQTVSSDGLHYRLAVGRKEPEQQSLLLAIKYQPYDDVKQTLPHIRRDFEGIDESDSLAISQWLDGPEGALLFGAEPAMLAKRFANMSYSYLSRLSTKVLVEKCGSEHVGLALRDALRYSRSRGGIPGTWGSALPDLKDDLYVDSLALAQCARTILHYDLQRFVKIQSGSDCYNYSLLPAADKQFQIARGKFKARGTVQVDMMLAQHLSSEIKRLEEKFDARDRVTESITRRAVVDRKKRMKKSSSRILPGEATFEEKTVQDKLDSSFRLRTVVGVQDGDLARNLARPTKMFDAYFDGRNMLGQAFFNLNADAGSSANNFRATIVMFGPTWKSLSDDKVSECWMPIAAQRVRLGLIVGNYLLFFDGDSIVVPLPLIGEKFGAMTIVPLD